MGVDLMVEIVCRNTPDVELPRERSGYGPNGTSTIVEGDVVGITIAINGFSKFGIVIREDGSIIIPNYGNLGWKMAIPQNVMFESSWNWRNPEEARQDAERDD